MEYLHIPVLAKECIEGLRVDERPEGKYLDCTLGGAGHSGMILSRLSGDGRLYAVDKDADAIAVGEQRLSEISSNFTLIRDDFKNVAEYFFEKYDTRLDGILADLGVSSYQLDNRNRGFSYNDDSPLDMRMAQDQPFSAEDVVNDYDESRLADIIWRYGEDKLSRRIAKNIVRYRENKRITNTAELANIVEKSYPPDVRFKFGNPCKRTFQAIRIEVNGELDGLYDSILKLFSLLKPGGRLCVISFYSLEDREVKRAFQYLYADCVCDKRMPVCTCGKVREGEIVTKKPITATEEELQYNSRASSAKLRIIERI